MSEISRREFLKAVGLAGGAVYLGGIGALTAPTKAEPAAEAEIEDAELGHFDQHATGSDLGVIATNAWIRLERIDGGELPAGMSSREPALLAYNLNYADVTSLGDSMRSVRPTDMRIDFLTDAEWINDGPADTFRLEAVIEDSAGNALVQIDPFEGRYPGGVILSTGDSIAWADTIRARRGV